MRTLVEYLMQSLPEDSLKSPESASVLRIVGCAYYREGNFQQALQEFNRALCFAVPGSVEMALNYANRSACYTECQMYDIAIENMSKALENGYPEEIMPKLMKRAEKCRALSVLIGDNSFDHWSFFRLSRPANPRIPFIANCLKLKSTIDFGRGIFTAEDLNVGDIVAIEEPLFHFIDPSEFYKRCNNCMKSVRFNLIPCLKCTRAMFCSVQCQESDAFHPLQCGNMNFQEELKCVLRMKQKALKLAGGVQQLFDIWATAGTKGTVFDFDLSDPTAPDYNIKRLTAVSMLAKNVLSTSEKVENLSPQQMLLATPVQSEIEEKKLLMLLREMYVIYRTNAYELYEMRCDTKAPHEKHIGGGLFPFLSLLNHSCFPNMSLVTVDNKSVLIAARPIKAGEQLFVSYGAVSRTYDHEARAKILDGFGIICQCTACCRVYPKLTQMEKIDRLFGPPRMTTFSHERAINQYYNNCDYIQTKTSDNPTFEVEFLVKHNDHLLHAIAKNIFDNTGQGKEKNVFCKLKYNFHLEEQLIFGILENNGRDYC